MTDYILEEQIGFILRQANQRHRTIFSERIDLAPAQFAALVKLRSEGPTSQNELGRQTAMDAATVKGVVDRLARQGLVVTEPHPEDGRRLLVRLTPEGRRLIETLILPATEITAATLEPLSPDEQTILLSLLSRIAGD